MDAELHQKRQLEKIDIEDEADWREEPKVSFERRATYQIAKWVLSIFGAVYFLSFILVVSMFWMDDVTFDGMTELVKFMLGSIIPLVTLAVGYYLGDRASSSPE